MWQPFSGVHKPVVNWRRAKSPAWFTRQRSSRCVRNETAAELRIIRRPARGSRQDLASSDAAGRGCGGRCCLLYRTRLRLRPQPAVPHPRGVRRAAAIGAWRSPARFGHGPPAAPPTQGPASYLVRLRARAVHIGQLHRRPCIVFRGTPASGTDVNWRGAQSDDDGHQHITGGQISFRRRHAQPDRRVGARQPPRRVSNVTGVPRRRTNDAEQLRHKSAHLAYVYMS